jgi:hypothetical protein
MSYMANCRVCLAEITWGVLPNGDRIPLDEREPRDSGEDRYRITEFTDPPKIEAVSPDTPRQAMVDHRVICRQPRVI